MRFKTIFLIFVLAMLMLVGVAWAEDDDDQGDNGPVSLDLDPNCDQVIIQAPSDTYQIIADYFQDGCVLIDVEQKLKIYPYTMSGLEVDVNVNESPVLTSIAETLTSIISPTILACNVCGDNTQEQFEEAVAEAARILKKDSLYMKAYDIISCADCSFGLPVVTMRYEKVVIPMPMP